MSRPKVYVLDSYHPAGMALIARHADVVRWDDPRVANWREDADGLMVRLTTLGEAEFAAARRLKAVLKQGVGVDNIDLAAAKRHGVIVCNTPGVNSEAVAEMALTLGLCAGRRVAEMDRELRKGGRVQRDRFLGHEAGGRRVGIIGMGNIGTRVARKWHAAFGAELIGYDPYVPADHWPDIPHRRAASLAELLREADILTIHCPLTEETRHMIGAAELALMQPHAILVNAARGGIVDEAALCDALRDSRIFAAGLDVFEVEPPTTETTPLLSLPNVVCTPHAAAGTEETQARSAEVTAQSLIDILAGRPPQNRVA